MFNFEKKKLLNRLLKKEEKKIKLTAFGWQFPGAFINILYMAKYFSHQNKKL